MLKKSVILGLVVAFLIPTLSFASSRVEYTDRGSVYITDEAKKLPSLLRTARNVSGQWHQDENGWWFEYADGTYPSNTWEEIDYYWYFFDGSGYMVTGWVFSNDFWYYCETSDQATAPQGSMITGWRTIDNEEYFFETAGTSEFPLGAMMTGWYTWEENKYYFRTDKNGIHPEGSMATGKMVIGELVYEFKDDGIFYAAYCPVVRRQQEKDNWCWAASAEMIGKYRNPASNATQGDIVSNFYIGEFDIGALTIQMPLALIYVGEDKISDTEINYAPLDFNETKISIENDEPFVGVLIWSNSGLIPNGHMVAITGYTETTNEIKIVDPWEDTPSGFVPYDKAVVEYQFLTGKGTYTDSVLAHKN